MIEIDGFELGGGFRTNTNAKKLLSESITWRVNYKTKDPLYEGKKVPIYNQEFSNLGETREFYNKLKSNGYESLQIIEIVTTKSEISY